VTVSFDSCSLATTCYVGAADSRAAASVLLNGSNLSPMVTHKVAERGEAMGKKDKDKKKKKWKEEEDESQDQSGKSPPGTYADGHPLHQIQYLEAKLILKPDRFTSVESFREFGKLVKKTAKKEEVDFRMRRLACGRISAKSFSWIRPTSACTTMPSSFADGSPM